MRTLPALSASPTAAPLAQPSSPGRRQALTRCAWTLSLGAALLCSTSLTPAWAQARTWQTEPVRQQAKALLQRWQGGELNKLDDEALQALFREQPTEVLVTAMQLGAGQHEGFEIRMQRQERIAGDWQDKPFLNHIRLRRQPQQVYMAWLSGGPKAGQEILFDARQRTDAMYGHLGGVLGFVSKWIALDGSIAKPPTTRCSTSGQRTVALTWSPGAADPAAYAARTRVCLNLKQPWALQIESWAASGEVRERILYERVEPKSFTDQDFDPQNPAYRF